jgi:hypothetical protein
MEADDPSLESIRRLARGALRQADVDGVVPVPIERVAEALRFAPPLDLFDLGGMPEGLLARVAMLKDKVLGALDMREHVIYLDRDQAPVRQRFHLGHELGHDVLPWHREAYYGDDRYTLNPQTKIELEAQASRFSVELLTGVDAFARQAAHYRLGLGAPLELALEWELSRAATIRHYVESHAGRCGLLKIGRFAGVGRVKVLAAHESARFRSRYGPLSDLVPDWIVKDDGELGAMAYEMITTHMADPVVGGTDRLADDLTFDFEMTSNGYAVFVLVMERQRIRLGRRVRPTWAA